MTTVARSGPFYDICAGRGIQLFLQQFVVFKFCAILGVVEYPKIMLTFRRKLIHVFT